MKKMLLLFVLGVTLTLPVFAGKVTGEFKSTEKGSIKPTSVAAFPVRSPGNPLKWEIALLLSEGSMDAAKALQSLDPRMALLNQEGMRDHNYITFWIRPDGYAGMNATFSKGMVQYIDSTKDKSAEPNINPQALMSPQALEATFSENSERRLAGRIRTLKPVPSSNGQTYELNVEFDTEIIRPPAGKKLSAGGGESGKAFQTLMSATKANDWKGVQAGVSSRIIQSNVYPDATDSDNLNSVIDSISFLLPKGESKIIGGEEFTDSAVLELEGEIEGSGAALYLVGMVKESGSWRFDHSMLVGFL